MALLLPSYFASQALFSTYYLAQPDDYDPVKPGMTAFETAEMEAALALVPRADTTKLFCPMTNSGSWNTAGNWYPSGVPGANSKVCIPEGVTVTTGPDDAVTKLFTVRCDGKFHPDPTVDMAIRFDTWVTTPMGSRRSGIRANRVPQGKTHRYIICTSNGDIDVVWDTFMQSRGMIDMGRREGWAAIKTPHMQVAAYTGPATGATSLTLASVPFNWQIDDEIVIGSTIETGVRWNGWTSQTYNPRNEKRIITNIVGAVITWVGGLTYDHIGFAEESGFRPDGTSYTIPERKCYVANLTRNVVTEPDDDDAPIHHRGHTMQMHNPLGGSARYERFRNLGRTAKHGGHAGRIVFSNAGCAANTPLPLSASPWWDAGASEIRFGPSFLVRLYYTASGAGNMTVDYTDEADAPQTLIVAYSSGSHASALLAPIFKAIQRIEFSTSFAAALPVIQIDARSRQINENGVRDLRTGSAVYTAIHDAVNAQGRYPMHWHKMGISGDILLAPPVLDGCVFDDSPGWGFAHHQTHGDVFNCVAYNCQGAGIVAEDGNETGLWEGNIALHMIGNDDITHKDSLDASNLDPARSGVGFWFTGRMVRLNECIGVGLPCAYGYNVRLRNVNVTPSLMDQPSSYRGSGLSPDIDRVPIAHFTNNVGVATRLGLITVRASPIQNHDLRTILADSLFWSCEIGMELTYTFDYTMMRCLTHSGWRTGDGDVGVSDRGHTGFAVGTNTFAQLFIDCLSKGYDFGIRLSHSFTDGSFVGDPHSGRDVVNHTFIDCTDDYDDYDPLVDNILETSDLDLGVRASLSNLVWEVITTSPHFGERHITGTKTDKMFVGRVWPYGDRWFSIGKFGGPPLITVLLGINGYWVDGAVKYLPVDEWFSDTVTGEPDLAISLMDVTTLNLTGYTNHGAADFDNNVGPVLAGFSVSAVRNTNLVIDVLGRATHPQAVAMSFGGFQGPMKGKLIDNLDGTITYVPRADLNYSESFFVWVRDINANTMRATCTVNVEKRALYLGRQDLLAA